MDVSPHELRDSEIPSAFRGYNPEVVDDLLERAAATIEGLQDKQRELTERLAAAEAAPAPARVATPTPPPAPAPAPAPVASAPATEEQMQEAVRTLVLAQRTADETISEAETRAREILTQAETRQRQLVEEAETRLAEADTRSRTLVADAEQNARAAAEAERVRVAQEVNELVAVREALTEDIEALDEFASSYRERLRAAIEAQLASLEAAPEVAIGERPALSELPSPAALDSGPRTQALPVTPPTYDDVPSPSSWSSFEEPTASAEESYGAFGGYGSSETDAGRGDAPYGTASYDTSSQDTPGFEEPAEASDFGSFSSFTAPTHDPAPTDEPAATYGLPDFGLPAYGSDDDPVDAETLDDDAFFASLREAVSDDAPLGGGSASEGDDDFGSAFRRRQ